MNIFNRYYVIFSILVLFLIPATSYSEPNYSQEVDTKGAPAATIIVTDPGDSGPNTLRQAVLDANPGDTIEFDLPGTPPLTISLTTGEILINKAITINGTGKEDLIISGSNNSRVFNIDAGGSGINVVIRNLSISDGDSRALPGGASPISVNTRGVPAVNQKGGGIYNVENLTLEDCIMTNNTSGGDADGGGGAIATRGAIVFIRRCHFLNNQDIDTINNSFGGAIDIQPSSVLETGFVLIEDSKFDGNSSQAGSNTANGGAIFLSRGPFVTATPPANISRTSFTNNFAQGEIALGGAVHNDSGRLTITNVVVLANEADGLSEGMGGGFYEFRQGGVNPGPVLDLLNCTVSQNIARGELAFGGGFYFDGQNTASPINTITNATISENVVDSISMGGIAQGYGGAIYNDDARIDLLASTIAFNEARGPDGSQLTGAAFFLTGVLPSVRYRNNLIVGNFFTEGGGTRSSDITARVPGMAVLLVPNCANDFGVGNPSSTYQSNGTSNITDSDLADDQCRLNFNPDFDASTMLGPLQNNGGFTLTHELLDTDSPTNPAIDAIPEGDCTNEVSPITRRMDDPFSPSLNKFYFVNSFEYYKFSDLSFEPLFVDQIGKDLVVPLGDSFKDDSNLYNNNANPIGNEPGGVHASEISAELELRGPPPMENPNDGRPFPRPFDWFNTGTALCDVGSLELQVEGIVAIEKFSNPADGTGFVFEGTNFVVGCDLDGTFTLDDGDATSGCILPQGTYTVEETDDQGLPFLNIDCDDPTALVNIDTPNATVTIDIINQGDLAFCTFTNSIDPILTVVHEGSGTGTSMSNPSGIDCPEDNCTQEFPGGTDITLTAAADPGSVFDGWSGDCPATAMSATSITLNANATCIATFSLLQTVMLDVTINGPGTGGVTSNPTGQIDCSNSGATDCDETYLLGETVTLTAMPEFGSVFVGWSGDGDCTGNPTDPVLMLTMNTDISCEANFDIQPVMLDVAILGPGMGGVTSNPVGQINCSNTGATNCDETYNVGAGVILTADPEPGSMFVNWSGDSACTGNPNNPVLSLTMNTDISCTAIFSLLPVPVVLDVTISGNGSGGVTSTNPGIDCSNTIANDCDESYTLGTPVTLMATPEAGSTFTGWSGDAECVGDPLTPTLLLVMNSDISCIATFITTGPDLVVLTVEIEGNGSGTVTSEPLGIDCLGDCMETVARGTTFTLTATPGPSSTFIGWSEDCTGEESDFSITVNEDSLCIATFVLNGFVLNPIFPGLDDNINSISAESATPGGRVAFTWAKSTGSLRIGGRVCNGTELGLRNPRLLSIVRANDFGVATHIFYIPTFNDLAFQLELQAVDIQTCRTSNIVPQIIRKDESG